MLANMPETAILGRDEVFRRHKSSQVTQSDKGCVFGIKTPEWHVSNMFVTDNLGNKSRRLRLKSMDAL